MSLCIHDICCYRGKKKKKILNVCFQLLWNKQRLKVLYVKASSVWESQLYLPPGKYCHDKMSFKFPLKAGNLSWKLFIFFSEAGRKSMAKLSNEFLLACSSEGTGTASCASRVVRVSKCAEKQFHFSRMSYNSAFKDYSPHDILINTACSPWQQLPDLAVDKLIFLAAQFIISSAAEKGIVS